MAQNRTLGIRRIAPSLSQETSAITHRHFEPGRWTEASASLGACCGWRAGDRVEEHWPGGVLVASWSPLGPGLALAKPGARAWRASCRSCGGSKAKPGDGWPLRLPETLMFLFRTILRELCDEPVPDHDGPGLRGSGGVPRPRRSRTLRRARAGGAVWGRAMEVPGLGALNAGGEAQVISVSCGSAGNCTVGGSYKSLHGRFQAWVASQVNGRWGTAIVVPGTTALNAGGDGAVTSVA